MPSKPFVFERPILIVAPPRAGSTVLFDLLIKSPDVYTSRTADSSFAERIEALHPRSHNFDSNCLTAEHATEKIATDLRAALAESLRNSSNKPPPNDAESGRLVARLPKSSLRIPFLNAIFPDAIFIYLYRDARENLASIMAAWESKKFITYPKLPGWTGAWSLLLTPGWRALQGKSLAEIAVAQWQATHQQIIDDLEQLPAPRWCTVRYSDLLAQPADQIKRLCNFAGIGVPAGLPSEVPPQHSPLATGNNYAAQLEPLLPGLKAIEDRAQELFAQYHPDDERAIVAKSSEKTRRGRAAARTARGLRGAAAALRFQASTDFLLTLQQLNCSLLLSTGRAGRLVIVREHNGAVNTQVRPADSAFGLACDGRRLALSTRLHLRLYRNEPGIAANLSSQVRFDGCFVPRWSHCTGGIGARDLAFSGMEIWIASARFSCLATIDRKHSFVPRWKPPFISALASDDRCHLNGVALADSQPAYVTALGETNAAGAWQDKKDSGGCLIDVKANRVVARNLALPHSPRVHNGQVWYVEGLGRLCRFDPATGRSIVVAEVPGFARGLTFAGHFAFVGVSRYRDGEPAAKDRKAADNQCGVWVIETRSGSTAAFLRFDAGMNEIYNVQVLPGVRVPEILTEEMPVLENAFVLPEGTTGRAPNKRANPPKG